MKNAIMRDLAASWGLRRARSCWRGDCPKCGTMDALAINPNDRGGADVFCQFCKQFARILPPKPPQSALKMETK